MIPASVFIPIIPSIIPERATQGQIWPKIFHYTVMDKIKINIPILSNRKC